MTVVGIDLSLTSTGVATVREHAVTAGVITSAGHRGDDLTARIARITRLVEQVLDWVPPGVLVVIEGPSYGSTGGSAWDRAGAWHRLVARLVARDCQVAVVAPATRAKWATGSGRSDKAAVAAVIARITAAELVSSDAADAVTLALMGAHRLGMRPDLDTAYRAECLTKAAWPHTLEATP